MSEFDEYIVHGEPGQREKADAWQTAIGLQDVDGLKVSAYLLDTARQHIEGDISIDEVRERIKTYYQTKSGHNTRTIVVFLIKYLRSLGIPATNDMFKSHSRYFRNALVRASYKGLNISPTTEFVERFLRNLILGENNELHNRDIIAGAWLPKSTLQCITTPNSKSQFDTFNCTLEELAALKAIEDNPKATQTELAKSIKKSSNPDVVPPNRITIKEAARWMATIASTDGVITPSERMLLKEFAETHGIKPNSLLRMAHAIANKVDVPEVEFINHNEMKGRLFEEFVVRLTSDSSRFTLLNWSSDKYVDGIYSLDTLMPDLYLRHQLDSETVEYYVECKYRSSLPDGILDICSQLSRYRHMISTETKKELFIAVGLGGTPSDPELFYMIPSRMIKNGNAIFIDHFSKCLCPKNPVGFHNYISHYFSKRVFKQI